MCQHDKVLIALWPKNCQVIVGNYGVSCPNRSNISLVYCFDKSFSPHIRHIHDHGLALEAEDTFIINVWWSYIHKEETTKKTVVYIFLGDPFSPRATAAAFTAFWIKYHMCPARIRKYRLLSGLTTTSI